MASNEEDFVNSQLYDDDPEGTVKDLWDKKKKTKK